MPGQSACYVTDILHSFLDPLLLTVYMGPHPRKARWEEKQEPHRRERAPLPGGNLSGLGRQ